VITTRRLVTGVSAAVLAVLFAGLAGAELPPSGGHPGVPPKPALTAPNKIPPPPVFEAAPATRTTGLENKPVRTKPLSSNAVGTLTPESGKWHSFVTVKGPAFAKAERVAVIWYPSDDATQAQAGSITATLRKRIGTDEIEIEMPRDAGGAGGGVVRVYLFMPNQLQPLLAGRFVVDNGIRHLTAEKSAATLDPLKNNTGSVGPELTSVTAISMFAIKAEWKPVASATSYVVKALESGKSQPASSPEYRANAVSGGISGLTPGFPHDVWVEARYPDKRVGASHIRQIATLNPVNPTDLSATFTGTGSVRLSWTPIPGAVHYIVAGSQLPKPLQTKEAAMTIDNVPMGRHEWRVMAAYGPGVYNDKTPAVVALILQSAGSTVTGASASEPNAVGAVGKAVGRAAKSTGKVVNDATKATGKAVRDAVKAVGEAVRGPAEKP
jgi:hypothetical protein